MASVPVLDVSSLTVRAGAVALVQDVSLAVRAGETLCVVGESGCGKSLTCLAAMGLLDPPLVATGAVRMFGQSLLGLDEAALGRIRGREAAMIFQNPGASLNPVQRVGDQVAEALAVHGACPAGTAGRRAVELLAEVGIPDPAGRARAYPHEISGGMAQRVMIAMAMACRPRLLFADEPTTALDVTVQAQIVRLLAELRQELGLALLFITHNLDLMAQICDRALVMYGGLVLEEAPVGALFATPQQPYTAALMNCVPRLTDVPGQLGVIEGAPPIAGRMGPGCPFEPRCAQRIERCATDRPPERVDGRRRVTCWVQAA